MERSLRRVLCYIYKRKFIVKESKKALWGKEYENYEEKIESP